MNGLPAEVSKLVVFVLALALLLSFAIFHLFSRKLGIAILSSTYLSGMIIGCGILPNLLMGNLQTYPKAEHLPWKSANVIVVLGSGLSKWPSTNSYDHNPFTYGRLVEALRLYRDCKAKAKVCHLIPSGGDPVHAGTTETVVMTRTLVELGAEATDIIEEPESNNTYQNALRSSALIKSSPFDFVVLVTSGFHLKRSMLLFSHFGLQPFPAPSDYVNVGLGLLPNAFNIAMTDIALHEYLGMMQFYIYNFMGWNKSPLDEQKNQPA